MQPLQTLHLTAKANRSARVFVDRAVENHFRECLVCFKDYGCFLQAYAMIPNHVHLLVATPDLNLVSASMRDILGSTARFHNRVIGQPGVLWHPRFHRTEVLDPGHLLHLPFYIHSNLCPRASDPNRLWAGDQSSHAAWLHSPPDWLDADGGLAIYGGVENYLQYCKTHMPRVETAARGGLLQPLVEANVLGLARELQVHPDTLLTSGRGASPDRIALAQRLHARDLTLTDIAVVLNVPRTTVRSWLLRFGASSPVAP